MSLPIKNLNKTLERLVECFATDFGDKTIHETLEDIKVISNDIEITLRRIASALERQLENQIKMNESVIQTLKKDDAGQDIWHLPLIKKQLQNYSKHTIKNGIVLVEKLKKLKRKEKNELR